jgi:drug/metabolite transporter (DMT)-like permease
VRSPRRRLTTVAADHADVDQPWPTPPRAGHGATEKVTTMLTKLTGAEIVRLPAGIARPSSRSIAILALLTAAVFFGSSTVASKAMIDHVPPITLAFGRFAIALIVLLALCRRAGVRPSFGRLPALLGLTGITLPYVCQNVGLRFATAVDMTLVIEGCLPIATAVLGTVFLGERMRGWRLIGLLLAVTGVGAVVLQGAAGRASFSGLGSVLAFGAAVSFAAYTVVGRRLFRDRFSLPVLTGSIAIGVLLLAPCAAVEIAVSGPGTMTTGDGLLLLYLGVGGSAGTQLLWARGMADLTAGEVAVFGTLMPVVGLASAAVFLGEAITLAQIGGGLVVGIGVYLTARTGRPVRSPKLLRAGSWRARLPTFTAPTADSISPVANRRKPVSPRPSPWF